MHGATCLLAIHVEMWYKKCVLGIVPLQQVRLYEDPSVTVVPRNFQTVANGGSYQSTAWVLGPLDESTARYDASHLARARFTPRGALLALVN